MSSRGGKPGKKPSRHRQRHTDGKLGWIQILSQAKLYFSARSSSPQCLGMGPYLEPGILQMIKVG